MDDPEPTDKSIDGASDIEANALQTDFDDELPSDGEGWESTQDGVAQGMFVPELKARAKISLTLRHWYSLVRSEYVDLISQLGGSSGAFLVHAESLILRFALDKEYRTDFIDSPQFIRLLFTIENFLQSIIECGGSFRLVFMNNYKRVLDAKSPALWTLRQCFLLMCQTSERSIDFAVFDSWTDPRFAQHVSEWQPPFILIDDCNDLTDGDLSESDEGEEGSEKEESEEKSEDEDETEEIDELTEVYPLAFILGCSVLQLHVATFFDIERHGRKIHAFVIPPHFAAMPKFDAEVRTLINERDREEAKTREESEVLLKSLMGSWTIFKSGDRHSSIGLRELIIAQFIKGSTSEDEEVEEGDVQLVLFFGKMQLIASQLARRLPLSQRCFVDFEKPNSWEFGTTCEGMIEFFLGEASEILDAIVSQCPRNTDDKCSPLFEQFKELCGPSLARDVADLIDSRLLMTTLILSAQSAKTCDWHIPAELFELPDVVCNDLNDLLCSVGGRKEPLFPISVDQMTDHFTALEGLQAAKPPKDEEPVLLPVGNEFIQRLLGLSGRKGHENGKLPFTVLGADDDTVGKDFWNGPGKNWTEDILVDMGAVLMASLSVNHTKELHVNEKRLERLKGAAKEEMRRRLQLQAHQRGCFRAHKFASSVAGISEFHHGVVVDKLGTHVWTADKKLQDEADAKRLGTIEEVEENKPEKKEKGKGKKGEKEKKEKKGEKESKKLSSRAEEIIKKNENAQKEKARKLDAEKLPVLERSIATVGNKALSPNDLLSKIFDLVAGYQRQTEELGSFKGVTSALKLPESQAKALVEVIRIIYNCLTKSFRATPSDVEASIGLHRLICFAFQFVHQVFRSFKAHVGIQEIQLMQNLLILLGFKNSSKCLFDSWLNQKLEDLESGVTEAPPPKSEKKGKPGAKEGGKASDVRKQKTALQNAYVDPSTIKKAEYAVPDGLEVEVQLKYMGHQMERTLGSTTDPRVKFKPDKWQVSLLNAIDERRSALVCAPTGCGKTFACYYAMEKTLSFSDDSVIVYVCPSKALVQQVRVEVVARFRSKEYPPNCRSVLCDHLLSGQHSEAIQAQIVLTLPSLLEMMLMSPGHRDWVSRLQYVILDEIHCIGEGDEEGRAWERLVQLMPCPFIALSATVGNPESFYGWLKNAHVSSDTVRHDNKRSVEVIHFGERYADLSTCVYSPDFLVNSNEIGGPSDTESTLASTAPDTNSSRSVRVAGGLYSLNPFMCLTYKQVILEGISGDFYVPSSDLLNACNILQSILAAHYTPQQRSKMSLSEQTELDFFFKWMQPGSYFVATAAISKKQYRYYLQTFKSVLVSLVQRKILTEELFVELLRQLGGGRPLEAGGSVIDGTVWEPRMASKAQDQSTSDPNGPQDTGFNLNLVLGRTKVAESYENTTELLKFFRCLNSLGLLPALLFNFNRFTVTQLCTSLVKALKDAQHDKYYGTPEAVNRTKAINKQRMDKYKALLKHREMLTKMRGLDKEQREAQGITTEDIDAELNEPAPPPPGDVADDYDEEFNFYDRRSWGTKSDEIAELVEDARNCFREANANSLCVEALERGIGLHHNGLPRRYRVAVESLFRKGFLRVVFSTETLAMGINMPCKSTVFIGDSLELTPLMYRQTSGRAGRRGFDTFGHVIFWEMPYSKMRRLICSRLPVLSGEFPISPTLVLRSFQLLNTVRTQHVFGLSDAIEKKRSVLERRSLQLQYKAEEVSLEKSMTRLYQNPLFSVSSVDSKENINDLARLRWATRYAFRFAVDMLRHSQLLDAGANCSGFAGLYNMLYRQEPCNGAVNWLLLSCGLHQYLSETCPNEGEVLVTDSRLAAEAKLEHPPWKLRRLIAVLAFCLCRVKLNYNIAMKMRRMSNVNPLLPSLPPTLVSAIDGQNQLALHNAVDYIRALSKVRAKDQMEEEHCLPFSGIDFNLTEADVEPRDGTLEKKLIEMSFKTVARSPFTAVAGFGDSDFISAEELCHSIRQTVYFEKSMVSQLKTRMVSHAGGHLPLLSNYVLDFFTVGKLSHTGKHSAIDRNKLWYLLVEFRDALGAMETYMEASLMRSTVEERNQDILYSVLREAKTFLVAALKKEGA